MFYPIVQRFVVASGTTVTMADNINEQTLLTTTIRGNRLGSNGFIGVYMRIAGANTADTKTFRVRLNSDATALLTFVVNASAANVIGVHGIICNQSASSQIGFPTDALWNASSSNDYPITAIDTTADVTLTITGQKSAANGGTNGLAAYMIYYQNPAGA